MDFKKIYDLTPKEKEILDWRQARREELRAKYLDSQYNPLNRKPYLDTGIQRWISQAMLRDQYFSGSVWTAALALGTMVGTIGIVTYYVVTSRARTEQKYRRGEVSYMDRLEKFK